VINISISIVFFLNIIKLGHEAVSNVETDN
jgi:hypothetical protein